MTVLENVSWPRAEALKVSLQRTRRRHNLRAFALVMPLLIFLIANFVAPIALMMLRSIQDPELPKVMPRTTSLLAKWEGGSIPDEGILQVFVDELKTARGDGSLGLVANRLNYDINGFRTLLFRTARNLPLPEDIPTPDALIQIDPRWGDPAYWAAMKHAAGPYTSFYLLAAVDRRIGADGQIHRTPAEQAIFVKIFIRTFHMSLVVTVACLLLGFPIAYLLATRPRHITNLLIILVVLPFWTPVLVRTAAWVVLLQREGMVNGFLQWTGLISEPLALIYNRTGVYVAMIYVLLPFMVLPLYGVMRRISPLTMAAALSLGARPWAAFRRVYLPQSLPGINAGCLLVFILSVGFYITPALVGGADDQMVSYFIAFYTNRTLNWGMASALGLLLLVTTLILYGFYNRAVGTSGPTWN